MRVFVSSTFTDTEIERNRLMADVYPYLSLLCKKLGLEFETVDMRWVYSFSVLIVILIVINVQLLIGST